MRTFYFVGGPIDGQGKEFRRRLANRRSAARLADLPPFERGWSGTTRRRDRYSGVDRSSPGDLRSDLRARADRGGRGGRRGACRDRSGGLRGERRGVSANPGDRAPGATLGSVSDTFLPDPVARLIPLWATALVVAGISFHVRSALSGRPNGPTAINT
jgi:hypothetical protein